MRAKTEAEAFKLTEANLRTVRLAEAAIPAPALRRLRDAATRSPQALPAAARAFAPRSEFGGFESFGIHGFGEVISGRDHDEASTLTRGDKTRSIHNDARAAQTLLPSASGK